MDKVKAGHCCFERPGLGGRFLTEIRIHCSIFLYNAKKDSPFVPSSGQLRKIFLLSAAIWTIFASLLEQYLGRYLQANHKWREMNNPPLHWRGFEFEFRLENGLAVQVFCIESCNKHLKTPQKWWNGPNGQQKPGKVSIFSLFYSRNKKKVQEKKYSVCRVCMVCSLESALSAFWHDQNWNFTIAFIPGCAIKEINIDWQSIAISN